MAGLHGPRPAGLTVDGCRGPRLKPEAVAATGRWQLPSAARGRVVEPDCGAAPGSCGRFVARHRCQAHFLGRAGPRLPTPAPLSLDLPPFRLRSGLSPWLPPGYWARSAGETAWSLTEPRAFATTMHVAHHAKLRNSGRPTPRTAGQAAPLGRPGVRRTHVRMGAIVLVPANQVPVPFPLAHVIDVIPTVVAEQRIVAQPRRIVIEIRPNAQRHVAIVVVIAKVVVAIGRAAEQRDAEHARIKANGRTVNGHRTGKSRPAKRPVRGGPTDSPSSPARRPSRAESKL